MEEKANGVCGPSEGCFNVLPTGARGEGLGTNRGIGQGAAGEAEMEDAGGKISCSSCYAPFDF